MSTEKPVGCRACGTNEQIISNQNNAYTIKLIENTVRVPSSEYTMNKSALNVYVQPQVNPSKSLYGVNWNQMSDRAIPGVLKTNVPSHGNSTRTSLTRMRPGSTCAAGKGVDIKHGSYDRYLARLKGKSVLRTAPETIPNNQKSVKWGIAYSESCTTTKCQYYYSSIITVDNDSFTTIKCRVYKIDTGSLALNDLQKKNIGLLTNGEYEYTLTYDKDKKIKKITSETDYASGLLAIITLLLSSCIPLSGVSCNDDERTLEVLDTNTFRIVFKRPDVFIYFYIIE